MWEEYVYTGLTINKLAERIGTSLSTVKRRLREVRVSHHCAELASRHGVIHLDTTYFNRNNGLLVVLEAVTNRVLYRKHVRTETRQEYELAIDDILSRGYKIDGIVSDGMRWLFSSYEDIPKQMCQFHMKQIVRRYLTTNPKCKPSQDLWELTLDMDKLGEKDFNNKLEVWGNKWCKYLNERTLQKDGKRCYKHRRLRSAVNSLKYFLPYLFTYERFPDMPSTNNRIEGFFSDLKAVLGRHRGMNETNRDRLIDDYINRHGLRQ